jgi:hypothetical protein
MLNRIPAWGKLHWAPRSMRCTILSPNGNPLIEMAPQSAEGRHQFGDWATLMHAAPDMLAALRDLSAIIGAFNPDDAIVRELNRAGVAVPLAKAFTAARAAIAKAEG